MNAWWALLWAMIFAWPIQRLVLLTAGFVMGVLQELRAIAKEQQDANDRPNSEDDKRPERCDPRGDDEAS